MEPAPRSPTGRRRLALVAVALVVVVVVTFALGARDLLERRRLLVRAARAIETRDLAELERVDRELEDLFVTRRERLPPRRDGILVELGGMRVKVQETIAQIRSGSVGR